MEQALYIPIIHGTTRPDNQSQYAAKLVLSIMQQQPGVVTELIDPGMFNLPFDGNDQPQKDPRYSEITSKADAFFIVTPEYNHSFPGTLKRLLDSELKNYKHKAVAFAGVSSGIIGGARAIESLLHVVRKMRMVASSVDVLFPEIESMFDQTTGMLKPEYQKQTERIQLAITELVLLAKGMRYVRDQATN
jgi:NAD(P)H-dependent FMN reductase